MQKNKNTKSILVIRTTAMGDVAMTVPVIEQYMTQNNDVNIIFLTSSAFVPFFRYIKGNIKVEVADLHGRHSNIRGVYRLFRELSGKYEIDLILDLQVKLYSRLLCFFFKQIIGVRTIQIDKGKTEKKEITRAENKIRKQLPKTLTRYAEVFKSAGYEFDFKEIPYKQRFEKIPDAYSFLKGEHLIGFSPLASYAGKQLPLPLVRSVVELLIERYPDYKILIFGGGRYEKMVGDSLEGYYGGHVYSTIGKMNISLEMDLMSNLEVMISMDSSAQHICPILGTPVVSIWGATQPITGFLGYSLNPEDNVVSLNLDCSPCSVYGDKPCHLGDRPCLTLMTPEMIVNKVVRIIQSSQAEQ